MLREDVDKRIRVYKEENLEEILSFTKGLYESGYIPYLLDYHKDHPERTIPFVFEEGKVIKAICFFHLSTEEDGWLMGMRVKKEYQKRGIAKIFTKEMIDFAEEKGLSWIGLNTSFKNRSVHNICKSLKFERYEAYNIYEFRPVVLKRLKQKRTFELIEVKKKDELERYFRKREIRRLLFVIDPGFTWIRITDTVLNELLSGKNFYQYNKNLISLQRWGENIVFNVFGKYNLSEYEDFLVQLYKEYPEKSKGRIIFCVRKADGRGISQLFSAIATQAAIKKCDVERSDWYVYGKSLKKFNRDC